MSLLIFLTWQVQTCRSHPDCVRPLCGASDPDRTTALCLLHFGTVGVHVALHVGLRTHAQRIDSHYLMKQVQMLIACLELI